MTAHAGDAFVARQFSGPAEYSLTVRRAGIFDSALAGDLDRSPIG
ncbi:hypothetical protein [Bradyrhizobium murdochi]|nr:hypothetical protein [Bradyrhizobium murdochi]